MIYIGSLSKIISPGLRIGWIYAPVPILQKVNLAKQGADLCSSSFSQLVAIEYLSRLDFEDHIERIRGLYMQKCKAMLEALQEFFPEEATWTKPDGGFFVWVTVDAEIDTNDMLSCFGKKGCLCSWFFILLRQRGTEIDETFVFKS